jgi:hypothetical protein
MSNIPEETCGGTRDAMVVGRESSQPVRCHTRDALRDIQAQLPDQFAANLAALQLPSKLQQLAAVLQPAGKGRARAR